MEAWRAEEGARPREFGSLPLCAHPSRSERSTILESERPGF